VPPAWRKLAGRDVGISELARLDVFHALGFGMIGGGHVRASGLDFPIEIWPNVSAFPAAGLAGELRLDIRQPDVIRPSVA
jgi:hypothetical protein